MVLAVTSIEEDGLKNIPAKWVALSLFIFCTACLYEEKPIPFAQQRSMFVETVSVNWRTDFYVSRETGLLENAKGQRLDDFLDQAAQDPASYITLSPYSVRALEQTKNLPRRMFFSIDQISVETLASSSSVDPRAELQVNIQKSGIKRHSCQATDEKLQFGCSVFINRAVSLVDPAELTSGQSFSYPDSQYHAVVFQNFLTGKHVPLRGGDR